MCGTATENVSIFDESFYFPSLKRHRRIWVYLPNGYDNTNGRYPVIYMHDGQNLFDEINAFGTEWGVDETLDQEKGQVIIIGIDNGGEHRMSEYMFHDHPEHGKGQGRQYLNDVANVLKPYVDNVLRTRPEKAYAGMAGSSMGGLISLYAGLYMPHTFGAIGIFSPAVWLFSPHIFSEVTDTLKRTDRMANSQRWYLYAGALESETMVAEVATLVKIMREMPSVKVTYQIDEGGIHDEAVWKNYFPNFFKWFTGKKPAPALEDESDIKIS